MRARAREWVALVAIAVVTYAGYQLLRALRYEVQAEAVRAAGRFMVGEIERERDRRAAVGCPR